MLTLRIFVSLSSTAQGALSCTPCILEVSRFFTFAFLWSSVQNSRKLLADPISYTKAFYKLNKDYTKFSSILNLSALKFLQWGSKQSATLLWNLSTEQFVFAKPYSCSPANFRHKTLFFPDHEAVFSHPPS